MSSSCEIIQITHRLTVCSCERKDERLLGLSRYLVVCVFSRPSIEKAFRQPPSHIPATSARAKTTERRELFHNWLEAGSVSCFSAGLDFMVSFLNQIGVALRQYKKIPHTFIYLFAYFLLSDVCVILTIYVTVMLTYSADLDQGLNTTGVLVVICQNDRFKFSFLQNTYLGLAQAVTSTASTFGFYYIQRHWKISTKKMVWSLPFFFSRERTNTKFSLS